MKKRIVLPFILILLFAATFSVYPVQALGNVRIVSESSYYDVLNALWIVGELENTGDLSTQFSKVTAVLYDSSNKVIGTEFGYSDVDVLLPNTKSPFAVLYLQSQGSLQVHHYSLTVSWSDYAAGKPLGLDVLSKTTSIDNYGYLHITGQIKNQGTLTARYVEAIATFYDSSGKVIGRDTSYTDPTNIAPGQTGNYDTELIYTQQVMKVASYSITVQSMEYANNANPSPSSFQSTAPLSSPSPTATPISTPPTPTPTSIPIQSSTIEPTTPPTTVTPDQPTATPVVSEFSSIVLLIAMISLLCGALILKRNPRKQ